MTPILIIVLGTIMVAAAIYAVYARELISSVLAAGAVSLFASILFLILGAPDVAMTEAAIGSGLTTVVFLLALRGGEKND